MTFFWVAYNVAIRPQELALPKSLLENGNYHAEGMENSLVAYHE